MVSSSQGLIEQPFAVAAVVIVEAPSADAVAKAVLAIASASSVRSGTLRAFTEAEYSDIIAALP